MTNNEIIVSVLMPVYNEENYIGKCIESLLTQDYDQSHVEYLLVDGSSADRTAELIEDYSKKYPFIKLLHNPNKTVPYAMNIGINAAKGKYIVRLDAHSEYSNDYVSSCVKYLDETGADNVGGPMVAKGKNFVQRAVAASYYSSFALGGGKFHDPEFQGYVDTVYLGAFKRDTLINIGMFDQRFVRNQDDELNYRIIKNGGKVFMTPKIRSVYYPRSTLKSLFSQYFQYGEWKVAVIRKHGKPARLSQLVPMLFVLFNIAGLATLPIAVCRYVYLIVLGLYCLLDIASSLRNKHAKAFGEKCLLCLIHPIMHISYGLGFIKGIFTKKGFAERSKAAN